MKIRRPVLAAVLSLLAAGAAACQPFNNFTTYFNLFYNMERIMDEVEQQLLYIREQKSETPTYYVPYDNAVVDQEGPYDHLERLSMSMSEAKANRVKLDSILLKGSKLLAQHGQSDYLDDAVYYIGKAYFYERDFDKSQQKCEELIANFPDSRWLPDAHLVLAMDQLHLHNTATAKVTLSRTIDVAWADKRIDVLVNAFRLNADVYLGEGNIDEALKPFKRALILSTSGEDRARWQYELAMVYYRAGDFDGALREFARVDAYSPSVLIQFETGLHKAAALRTLEHPDEAAKVLADLRDNSNYEEWTGLVDLQQMEIEAQLKGNGRVDDQSLALLDSAYPSGNYSAYGIYERAIQAYRAGDYATALPDFQRVQSARAPFQDRAQRMASLLSYHQDQSRRIGELTKVNLVTFPDSTRSRVATAHYNLARTFSTLQKHDSMALHYRLSRQWARPGSYEEARAIYGLAMMALEDGRRTESDSLLEILVEDHEQTAFAEDARQRLGYTEAAMHDPEVDLYTSGTSFMKVKEYRPALEQFKKLVATYPQSRFAPAALYAIGLIYEKQFDRLDSAFVYYARIVNEFPDSEHADRVRPLVAAVINAQSGGGASPQAHPDPQLIPLNETGNLRPDSVHPGVDSTSKVDHVDPSQIERQRRADQARMRGELPGNRQMGLDGNWIQNGNRSAPAPPPDSSADGNPKKDG